MEQNILAIAQIMLLLKKIEILKFGSHFSLVSLMKLFPLELPYLKINLEIL